MPRSSGNGSSPIDKIQRGNWIALHRFMHFVTNDCCNERYTARYFLAVVKMQLVKWICNFGKPANSRSVCDGVFVATDVLPFLANYDSADFNGLLNDNESEKRTLIWSHTLPVEFNTTIGMLHRRSKVPEIASGIDRERKCAENYNKWHNNIFFLKLQSTFW